MKIVHIVPSIEAEASGPSYSVSSLCKAINRAGAEAQLAATGAARVDREIGLQTFPRRAGLYRLGRSPEMLRWLRAEIASDTVYVVHNHSIWMMPNVYPGWATRETNIPLVISPRGTFSEWAMRRSRAIKFLFWHGFQKRAIDHAALFHATAESEYEDIRRLGFRQPVAVIPNGIDIPGHDTGKPAGERTLLFLGRVHPVKGVDMLLKAWIGLQSTFPDWSLRIVGPGDIRYLAKLQALARSLVAERVSFAGSLYGGDKTKAYRAADLFVLPTHSENFGMTVAEALAAGCPVVTTKSAPWSGLVEQRAGWWIDIGVEPLRLALGEAMSKHRQDLAAMGARGRAWMERDFSWDRIAAQMIDSYRWVREGGTRPQWIRND